jgi:hypothetical protein
MIAKPPKFHNIFGMFSFGGPDYWVRFFYFDSNINKFVTIKAKPMDQKTPQAAT